MNLLRALSCAWLICQASYVVAAPTPAPSALGGLVEQHTAAGKQTVTVGGIDFDNRGRPLDARSTPTIETDGAASAKTTGTGSIKNPSGNPVPVTVTGRVAPAAAAAAIGRFAAKIAYPLTVGMALYQLAQELGFKVGNNPDGSLMVQKKDPAVCTVAPCYNYRVGGAPYIPTREAACVAAATGYNNSQPFFAVTFTSASVTGGPAGVGQCSYTRVNLPSGTPASGITFDLERQSVAPSPNPVYLPSTQQEFIDAVATKSGWPSTSSLSQVLEDAAKATGEKLKPQTQTLTGPATSPGTTSTKQKVDGTTETNTVTHNHSYAGNTVTTTTTTVVNNYNPTTNITTTETTTETPPKDEEQPEYQATDALLPDQPKLYERKYPDGPAKVWADRKVDFMGSPLLQLVTGLTPNIPAAACPQFTFSVNLGFVNFGTYSLGPECYVWDFCKIVILISALFLARALIFGG